jgi:hypothetical protein
MTGGVKPRRFVHNRARRLARSKDHGFTDVETHSNVQVADAVPHLVSQPPLDVECGSDTRDGLLEHREQTIAGPLKHLATMESHEPS